MTTDLAKIMREKAALMSSTVVDAPNMAKAFDYLIELCEKKAPAVLLVEEPGTEQGPVDPDSGLPSRTQRILAAPDLPTKHFNALKKLCDAKEWLLLRKDLRRYPGGIDLTVNWVEHAIAASGTCIIQTTNEDTLIASGLSEINVMFVPISGLLPDLKAAVPLMHPFMNTETPAGGTYTTFISGPSRTGDIEQVTTLGAHGPIEMHIVLLEG